MKLNPFKRQNQSMNPAPAMPPELNDYYNAEKRQRTVVTWLLGLATLAVTVALAFALFLGARWVINKIHHQAPTPQPTTVETTSAPAAPPAPTTSNESGTTNSAAGSPSTATNQTKPTTSTNTQAGQTSSATTALPNTGPGDVLAIMLGTTVLGTLAHRRYARR